MFESTSPFDDALAKPLLDEPVKKRWCLGTTVLSSKSSALSQSWVSSSRSHAQAVPVYQASDHPDLEEIDFKSSDGHNDAELGLLLSRPSSIGRTTSQEAYDLDFAILRERHQDITDINKSLLQINEIGKGKKQLSQTCIRFISFDLIQQEHPSIQLILLFLSFVFTRSSNGSEFTSKGDSRSRKHGHRMSGPCFYWRFLYLLHASKIATVEQRKQPFVCGGHLHCSFRVCALDVLVAFRGRQR
jgi:hypothetical protein